MVEKFDIRKVIWQKGYKDLPQAYYPIKVPGVTSVLASIPDPDYDKFIQEVGEEKAKQITQAAMERGVAMHAFIENFIKELAKSKDPSMALQHTLGCSPSVLNEENIPMEKIDKGREMFLNFYYSDHSNAYTNLIGTELSLYSPSLFFRGKADVFYNMNGIGRAITDFKTSSKPIEKGSVKEYKYKLQLGAYALSFEEMLKDQNVVINRASILVVMTKSAILQEIICEGEELGNMKSEFKTLVRDWHIKNNQEFLFNEVPKSE